MFKKATKLQAKLRLALIGPAGSGKTYSALAIAKHLGQKVAVLDTERGSASLYADLFDFDVMEITTFGPQAYIDAINAAQTAGYDVLVIDSLSHAWMGKEGILEMKDNAVKRGAGNDFTAWRDVTPAHNALVDAMLQADLHLIATMRAKTEYVMEKDDRTGKMVPRKVGLQPVQRDGLEYEFTVVGDMTPDNDLVIGKTRCYLLTGRVFNKPGEDVAAVLLGWLTDGTPPPPAPTCTQCGHEIKDHFTKEGKRILVDVIVKYSLDEFGKQLCFDCSKKHRETKNGGEAEPEAEPDAADELPVDSTPPVAPEADPAGKVSRGRMAMLAQHRVRVFGRGQKDGGGKKETWPDFQIWLSQLPGAGGKSHINDLSNEEADAAIKAIEVAPNYEE